MSGNFNATSNSVSSFEFMLTVRIFHSDLRRSGRRDYIMILLHTMGNNHAEKVADGLFVHFYREHWIQTINSFQDWIRMNKSSNCKANYAGVDGSESDGCLLAFQNTLLYVPLVKLDDSFCKWPSHIMGGATKLQTQPDTYNTSTL